MTERVASAEPARGPDTLPGPDIVEVLREVDLRLGQKRPTRAVEEHIFAASMVAPGARRLRALWLVPVALAALVALRSGSGEGERRTPGERALGAANAETSDAAARDADRGAPSIDDVVIVAEPTPETPAHEVGLDHGHDPASPEKAGPTSARDRDDPSPLRRRARPRWNPSATSEASEETSGEGEGEDDAAARRPQSRRPRPVSSEPFRGPLRSTPGLPGERGRNVERSARRSATGGSDGAPQDAPNDDLDEAPLDAPTEADRNEDHHEDGAPPVGCDGLDGTSDYAGYFCAYSGPFIVTAGISCEDALANCELNATSNPSESVLCTWNGIVIFENESAPGACDGLLDELEDAESSRRP